MGVVLSIANQKGGVAKTTTALNLASGLARKNLEEKVLFIDLDSQRNATSLLLKKMNFEIEETIYPVFQEEKISSRQIHHTFLKNLKSIPASLKLVDTEGLLANSIDGFFKLNEGLENLKKEFKYIIIDCPPSLSVLTINSLVASNYLIIPLQVSKFSIDGIQTVLDAVNTVKKRYNPYLEILGGVLTMYDARTTLSRMTKPKIKNYIKIFQTTIPRSVLIEESYFLKSDIFEYAPKSKVALAYNELCREVYDAIR